MVCVVAPVDHWFPVTLDEVKVTLEFGQIINELAVIVAVIGSLMKVKEPISVHSFAGLLGFPGI